MALRSDWSQRTCSMARGLDILGDPWSMLVLREVFFGNGRFEAMKQRLGAADSVLTKRLAGLVAAGLLTRRPYDDGGRTRQEYVLTAKGEDALPVLNAVVIWAEKAPPGAFRAGAHVRHPQRLRGEDLLRRHLYGLRGTADGREHELAQPHPHRGPRTPGLGRHPGPCPDPHAERNRRMSAPESRR